VCLDTENVGVVWRSVHICTRSIGALVAGRRCGWMLVAVDMGSMSMLAGRVYVKILLVDPAFRMVLDEASRPGRRMCWRGGLVS
jgi:hypothetical protein